jgi:hypothetical protein
MGFRILHRHWSVKMNKFLLVFIVLFAGYFCAHAATPAKITLDFQSKQRKICGFTFNAVKDLVVVAMPISEESRRTRVDNERYDACPYNVELTYRRILIRFDFSNDVTLGRIRNSADDGFVRTAFFRQDENGWEAAGEDVKIEKSGIAVHQNQRSLALSAILRRTIQNSKKQDFCFNVDIIGEKKYLTGAVCRPAKSELEAIDKLFREKLVISSSE